MTWFGGWVVGMLVAAPVALVAIGADLGGDLTIPQLLAATCASWVVSVAALMVASRRFGTGDLFADLGVKFRAVDLVGLPIGVAAQVGLIPLLYIPLRNQWPATFSEAKLEERARELVDQASGVMVVVLVLIVVFGAPIVEELMYRGLIQRSLNGAIGVAPALVVASIWFAFVHQSPVEYPGLFLAGLLFGGCVAATKRVGPAILTHAAFNATGLALAFWQ